jgi:uncharacterized membrane protein YkgB
METARTPNRPPFDCKALLQSSGVRFWNPDASFERSHRETCRTVASDERSRVQVLTAGRRVAIPAPAKEQAVSFLTGVLTRCGLLKEDLDYHLVRASMVIIFLFFGYQKWFQYEAQVLVPFISNGPLTFWMYPVFGVRGASWFLGVAEWMICALLFLGFWNKELGVLGALGSAVTFVTTVTIIPFMPNGWAESAGGFPAMTGNVPFLMKDVVLLAVSIYLLKQDVVRVMAPSVRGGSHASVRTI